MGRGIPQAAPALENPDKISRLKRIFKSFNFQLQGDLLAGRLAAIASLQTLRALQVGVRTSQHF